MLREQLDDILQDLSLLGFEMSLVAGAMILLVIGLIRPKQLVSQVIFVAVLVVSMLFLSARQEAVSGFGGVLIFDSLGNLLKLVFGISALWIVLFPTAKGRNPEFYFLTLSVIIGSVFMLSANHLLVIFLAVELTSFASYLITNFNFRKRSFEAGLKYLLFGGVSSAVALYGASLIYGFTGTLLLSEMDFNLLSNPQLLNFGLLTFIGGLFFKISLVPFHIWVPSAYEEAPTESVAILATIPKIGAFVLLHRVFVTIDLLSVSWLLTAVELLGIATIIVGTLGAMRQSNAKRLVSYGAIAHSGFLLVALLIPGETGGNAFIWYSFIYILMNISVFYLLSVFESAGIVEVQQFAGLGKNESYMGGLLVLIMIALTGLPPTAGFTAKFYLFSAMWSWYQDVNDPLMLIYLIVGVFSVVFSLFFYLKIPFHYFLKERNNQPVFFSDFLNRLLATIFIGLVLWFFFRPDLLNNIVENINFIDW